MSEPRHLVLVKLGGSLITDKTLPGTARPKVMTRLAEEVRQAVDELPTSLIVGHGSGSFGHVVAHEFEIHRGVQAPGQLPGVSATQEQSFKLHLMVMTALRAAGVAALSLVPSSFVMAKAGQPDRVWPDPLVAALRLGLVPVVFGDVVMDREWGASICSTESLFRALVPALAGRGLFVRRVAWLGETDGVYDGDGRTLREIEVERLPEVARDLEGAAGTDVTGGMRHRLETAGWLANQGISSWIGSGLRAGSLLQGLQGNVPHGTEVPPGRR